MTYIFSADARVDLLAAADFYDSQRPGLGAEFASEFESALARLRESPQRWPEIEPGIRRYRVDRFPYAIIYRMLPSDTLEIIAVFHLRRRPGTWRR